MFENFRKLKVPHTLFSGKAGAQFCTCYCSLTGRGMPAAAPRSVRTASVRPPCCTCCLVSTDWGCYYVPCIQKQTNQPPNPATFQPTLFFNTVRYREIGAECDGVRGGFVYVCRTREEMGWKLAVEHPPPLQPTHNCGDTWIHSILVIFLHWGKALLRFLLYHLLCTIPPPSPPPWICNRSTETSKHRSNRCDRRAVSDNEQNTPPTKKKFRGQ